LYVPTPSGQVNEALRDIAGVVKRCVVIETQVATEPNESFLHSPYIRAYWRASLGLRVIFCLLNTLISNGYFIFRFFKIGAVLH
jgi:hypothetical protein